ncbi:single-stranded DNA-binding protein, mitochondrial-like isoform X1 [Hordeum vulgare subsp. vulgare]|nr:single-stranded DNA-binding protein, mitochondrial-like isoform X1 [Hordeum vulgare subsp. vulgare]
MSQRSPVRFCRLRDMAVEFTEVPGPAPHHLLLSPERASERHRAQSPCSGERAPTGQRPHPHPARLPPAAGRSHQGAPPLRSPSKERCRPLCWISFHEQARADPGGRCSRGAGLITMGSVGTGLLKGLRRVLEQQRKSVDLCRTSRAWSSTVSFSDIDEKDDMGDDGDLKDSRRELEPQSVDPKKGWGFRGVHRAIICGKVGQAPVQKILRNGRTVTIFTIGTGGMFDQRVIGSADTPKPAQWHRIAVHSEHLGAYAVQKLVKNSAVYIEGDIETRIYNDGIDGQVRNIPEICIRGDGKIRLVKSGESAANISLDELRDGLF